MPRRYLTIPAPWSISKPDLVVRIPQPVAIPAMGKLDYVCEIVPAGLTEGRWIQMAEVLPFVRANLLQIMVVIRRPGSHWLRHAPAGTPFRSATLTSSKDRRWSDDDMGKFIPAGSDLVFCAQYITNGVAGSDQSSVGLVFFKQPPSQRVITLALEDRRFTIPPMLQSIGLKREGFCGEVRFF